mmetsp:Transcript_7817/g.23144  ORF Transcript_7817/g.23144 Transcript_7817/m.23144 type:complete len:208 (-) Transcript_7817:125-748(-)
MPWGVVETNHGLVGEMVRRERRDDPLVPVVHGLEDRRVRALAQIRVDAHDGPELCEVVSPLVVLAQQMVQNFGDGPCDGRQKELHNCHYGGEFRRDLQLLAACEHGGRDDLAEHEHECHRQDHGHPRGHDLVQEQRQGLVRARVEQQQCHEKPVVVLDERQNPLGRGLVLLQLVLVLVRDDVLVLGVDDDVHLHRLDGYQAHGQAGR